MLHPRSPAVVLVTSRSFGSGDADPTARITAAGLTLVRGPANHELPVLRPLLADAAAWVAGVGPVTGEHLDAAPRLRVIARYGTGVDGVDLAAAVAREIVVTNTPGAASEAVADHAIALMLAMLRSLIDADRGGRAGHWSPHRSHELGALTVGMIGFGAVARAVARRLTGFGSRMAAYDPYVPNSVIRCHGVEPVNDLTTLAARSDVVSLHLPGGGAPIVDHEFLERLPPGAVIVNTARAELVDEEAVAEALARGRLAGVAADVVTSFGSPLHTAANVIITPHIAAQTVEAIDRMTVATVEEVLRVLSGEPPHHPVVPTDEGVIADD